jgi:hypothetical protein
VVAGSLSGALIAERGDLPVFSARVNKVLTRYAILDPVMPPSASVKNIEMNAGRHVKDEELHISSYSIPLVDLST